MSHRQTGASPRWGGAEPPAGSSAVGRCGQWGGPVGSGEPGNGQGDRKERGKGVLKSWERLRLSGHQPLQGGHERGNQNFLRLEGNTLFHFS